MFHSFCVAVVVGKRFIYCLILFIGFGSGFTIGLNSSAACPIKKEREGKRKKREQISFSI